MFNESQNILHDKAQIYWNPKMELHLSHGPFQDRAWAEIQSYFVEARLSLISIVRINAID